jgi:hypothetical protein
MSFWSHVCNVQVYGVKLKIASASTAAHSLVDNNNAYVLHALWPLSHKFF